MLICLHSIAGIFFLEKHGHYGTAVPVQQGSNVHFTGMVIIAEKHERHSNTAQMVHL
jgi:hypothetical protein